MSSNPFTTLDHDLALASAVGRLAEEFTTTFNAETIGRYLESSFAELSAHATVSNFIPLLAERFARQRLQALARAEGLLVDGKPVVLFLCLHNAGRSQMALGFFNHYAGRAAVGWSGGSEPAADISTVTVHAMAERGIDISAEFPKPWTDEVVQAADVVVTMGCGEACPLVPGKRYEDWPFEEPTPWDLDHVRPVRDGIERQVRELLVQLEVPLVR